MKKNIFLFVAIACLVSCTQESVAPQPPSTQTVADPPVISLFCQYAFTHPLGIPFTIPGATASDNQDGDITHLITVVSSVDVNNVGTYPVVYSVMDSDSNAVSDTVLVTVITGIQLFEGHYDHSDMCALSSPGPGFCTISLDSANPNGIVLNNFGNFGININLRAVVSGNSITMLPSQQMNVDLTFLQGSGTILNTYPMTFTMNYTYTDGVAVDSCSGVYTRQ